MVHVCLWSSLCNESFYCVQCGYTKMKAIITQSYCPNKTCSHDKKFVPVVFDVSCRLISLSNNGDLILEDLDLVA